MKNEMLFSASLLFASTCFATFDEGSAASCGGTQDETCLIQTGQCDVPSPCIHGKCLQLNSTSYRCYCTRGFSGVFCDDPIDECKLQLCQNNATCVNAFPQSGFSCTCSSTFSGIYCETPVDFCQQNPCLNNATCHLDPATGFHCDCPSGLTGTRCETDVDECVTLTAPCRDRGTCRNTLGSFECQCRGPYTGNQCQNTFCSSQITNPCQNGRCILDSSAFGGFTCNCTAGFTGETCDQNTDDCVGVTCNGRGLCVDDINRYECLCLPGWTGPNCEARLDECSSNQCQNGANCTVQETGGYTCACPTAYDGRFCEVIVDHCQTSPCMHGACENLENTYDCQCERGWTGENCTVLNCDGVECLHGGQCYDIANGSRCQCLPEWTGDRCQHATNPCLLEPCRNSGLCSAYPDSPVGYQCWCPPDFGGYFCEVRIDDCLSSPCANGGTCIDGIANFTCHCRAAFTGWRCDSVRPFPVMTRPSSFIPTSSPLITPTPVYRRNETTPAETVIQGSNISQLLLTGESSILFSAYTDGLSGFRSSVVLSSLTAASSDPVTINFASSIFPDYNRSFFEQTVFPFQERSMLSSSLSSRIPAQNFPLTGMDSATLRSSVSPTISFSFPTRSSRYADSESVGPTEFPPSTLLYSTNVEPETATVDATSVYFQTPSLFTAYLSTAVFSLVKSTAALDVPLTTVSYYNASNGAVPDSSILSVTDSPSVDLTRSTWRSPFPVIQTIRRTTRGYNTTSSPLLLDVSSPDSAACLRNFCRNGGTCRVYGGGQFRCDCPMPFYGDVCEEEALITRPVFSGRSWIQYPPVTLRPEDTLDVAIRFLAPVGQSNTTLFHAVSLQNRNQFVRLDILNNTAFRFVAVCIPGYPVELVVRRPRQTRVFTTAYFSQRFPTTSSTTCTATLRSDTGSASSGFTVPQALIRQPNVTFDAIYIGGYPGASGNFSGQISNVAIGGNERNFREDPVGGVNIGQASQGTCGRIRCQNNATCHESLSAWTCICQPGYTGPLCEIPSCSVNPCVGGSTCVAASVDSFHCVCPLGRYGMYCEQTFHPQSEVRFFGTTNGFTSYISFAPIKSATRHLELNITISLPVVPAAPDSLNSSMLLLIGTPDSLFNGYDFLLIGLQGATPVLVYNFGGGPTLVASPVPLDLGQPVHSIQVYFDQDLGVFISADNAADLSLNSFPSTYRYRNFDQLGQVFVGGFDIMDVSPIQGFERGFNGSLLDIRFRIKKTGDFVPFSKLLGGRNVLPTGWDNMSLCVQMGDKCNNCTSYGASFSCCASEAGATTCSMGALSTCGYGNHSCQAGSVCVPDKSLSGYHCNCPLGRTGSACETDIAITDAKFNGFDSYLVLAPLTSLKEDTIIRMSILPNASDGLLFYVAEQSNSRSADYLSLFLTNWTVSFRFNMGSYFGKSMSANVTLSANDTWFTVEAGRNNVSAWLTVGNSTISTDIAYSMSRVLDVFTTMYVGGLSDWDMLASSAYSGVPTSFGGCIRDLVVNEQRYYLGERNAVSGMNIEDCDGTECGFQLCENGGSCQMEATGDKFTRPACKCDNGYFGSQCESPPDCADHICQNLGVCVKDDRLAGKASVTCDCPVGTWGDYCENTGNIDTTGQFSDKSYLQLREPGGTVVNQTRLSVSFAFRTNLSDCMLVWLKEVHLSQNNFLGIGLVDGHLELIWSVSWESRRVIVTPGVYRFDDGNWHQVFVSRHGSLTEVFATNQHNSQKISAVDAASTGGSLEFSGDTVYHIGSFPRGNRIPDETLGYFSTPFAGCFGNLTFHENGALMSFMDASDGRNIMPCLGEDPV